MVPQKVQIEEADLEFIETACKLLSFKSKSDYMRTAIRERIVADKRLLRELRRSQAMKAYGDGFEAVFESLEGDDFEPR